MQSTYKTNRRIFLQNPFDALVLYVTQAALDEVAYAHRAPRVEQLVWPHGKFDPVVYHLGKSFLASLERTPSRFQDFPGPCFACLELSFCLLLWRREHSRLRSFGAGSRLVQMRRATELLEAHLDGNIALQQVAEACELSVSHFARAFKQTFRTPPYRWLIERRVDRARDLMTNSRLPLADIAIQCGFADQSALNRSFKRIHGVTPGTWRRGQRAAA